MQMKYDEEARQRGVYIVGSCGWDSIPADIGIDFLKKKFSGILAYVESAMKNRRDGYSFNAATYHSLIMGLSSIKEDKLDEVRRAIMPGGIPMSKEKPPKRATLWQLKEKDLDAWVLPFLHSVIQRTKYRDFIERGDRPVVVNTYFALSSFFWASIVSFWFAAFTLSCQYEFTRKILHKYPEQTSFYMFKETGPTLEQMKQSSCSYHFYGTGWPEGERVVCRGPDPGYIGAAACAAAAAAAFIHDRDKMPKEGGVYTPAIAFRGTRTYEYLEDYGITFEKEEG